MLENKEYGLGELIYYGWPIFAGGRRAADGHPALFLRDRVATTDWPSFC